MPDAAAKPLFMAVQHHDAARRCAARFDDTERQGEMQFHEAAIYNGSEHPGAALPHRTRQDEAARQDTTGRDTAARFYLMKRNGTA